jgi:hypothetical protein
MKPEMRAERRLSRAEEIDVLLTWNGELFNAKIRNQELLLAADDIGALVIIKNLRKLEAERRDLQFAAEQLFAADALAYISRKTANETPMPSPWEGREVWK